MAGDYCVGCGISETIRANRTWITLKPLENEEKLCKCKDWFKKKMQQQFNVPFDIDPDNHCTKCPHGYCVSYIREESKKMKDRDTLYRISQSSAMACSFDLSLNSTSDPDFMNLVEKMISNAESAGMFFDSKNSGPFQSQRESKFVLTANQKGKVRGDSFETLLYAHLWNYLAHHNTNPTNQTKFAFLNLGDNFDLRRLFTKMDKKKIDDLLVGLDKKGMNISYSTPDLILVDITKLPDSIIEQFSLPIETLSKQNQQLMQSAKDSILGLITAADVKFAIGVKTSIRSDRMYQFLYEACAWKFIWEYSFGISKQKYFTITTQTFGADPRKLKSVKFSGFTGVNNAQRAIDGVSTVKNTAQLRNWFNSVFSEWSR